MRACSLKPNQFTVNWAQVHAHYNRHSLKSRLYSRVVNHSDVTLAAHPVQQYSCTNASSTTHIRRQTFDALLSAGLRLQILTFVSSAG